MPPLPPTPLFAAERGAVLVSCALSCVGSALLLCSHALWPELRTRPRQLLLYLSLADLLSALSYSYGVLRDFQRSSWDCVLQGAVSTFANTSSFFWTMAIALYLYLSIVRGSPAGSGWLWGFHAVSLVSYQVWRETEPLKQSWLQSVHSKNCKNPGRHRGRDARTELLAVGHLWSGSAL